MGGFLGEMTFIDIRIFGNDAPAQDSSCLPQVGQDGGDAKNDVS
jgi:hypothetical protein